MAYDFTDQITMFGGIHKGFAPPSPSSTNEDNEESINYELGARYNSQMFNAELVGFLMIIPICWANALYHRVVVVVQLASNSMPVKLMLMALNSRLVTM